tara:strand:+ start:267 stop:1082 length:816 start_codon:yes stop_codon:yes gene_type:complete
MRVYWQFRNISLLLAVFCYFSCVGQEIICKDNTKPSIEKEAIVILPGFGDSKKGRNEQEKFFKEKGYDLFIPEYMDKFKVDNCVENLHEFYDKNQLKDYKKIHFFSYILGSWVLNKFINKYGVLNISTIVYDRSPTQERAPYLAAENLNLIISIMGIKNIMNDMAGLKYPPIENKDLDIGIIIESKATKLLRILEKKALEMGPLDYKLESLNQKTDDYLYTWLNHDQMYERFDVIGEEIFYFIENHSFSNNAVREQYNWNPFTNYKKEGLK